MAGIVSTRSTLNPHSLSPSLRVGGGKINLSGIEGSFIDINYKANRKGKYMQSSLNAGTTEGFFS
jgi:hypothetical protein